MIKSRQQLDIGNLLDLHTEPERPPFEPLSPTGGPLTPDPKQRPPYDELHLKQRYDRDYFKP